MHTPGKGSIVPSCLCPINLIEQKGEVSNKKAKEDYKTVNTKVSIGEYMFVAKPFGELFP